MEIKDLSGLGAYSPIIHELYKDMAQPAARNVGLALGAITSVGLFLHLLTSWGTDRLNLCLKNNLEEYADRIKKIPPEDITEAPPEVAIPIIEKLSYVTNEELRSLYIELLAKASIKEENDKAHPSFINIINSLSPDEAILLKYFKENPSISPSYFFETFTKKSEAFAHFLSNNKRNQPGKFFGPPELVELQFPHNLSGYLENFEGLGIIYMTESNSAQVKMFRDIEETINRNLDRAGIQVHRLSLLSYSRLNEQRQSLYVTNYGKLFIKAVIETPETPE
ncbi:DUF4393 domain-containing protein [Acinetobacter sp. AHP123]|uniref:DUF4393 domain-containing protein n=1 Tax=Acinetobacter sp. AHP123 TaxID=2913495 RepID=UPI0020755100|nr:DUF4393 domain-containing protein [Acinetobacter sp. AHP123]